MRVEKVAKVGIDDRGSDGNGGAKGDGGTEDGKEGVEGKTETATEDVVAAARGGRVKGVGRGEFERMDVTDMTGVGVGAKVDGAETRTEGNIVEDVRVRFRCRVIWVEAR